MVASVHIRGGQVREFRLRHGMLSRGHFCPKDHQQHLELARYYPPSPVACTQIATIWTGNIVMGNEFRGDGWRVSVSASG
jgi:hypothetical protein